LAVRNISTAVERAHLRQDGAALAARAHIVPGGEQARGQAARLEVLPESLGLGNQLGRCSENSSLSAVRSDVE
jgi:hypothetical protein